MYVGKDVVLRSLLGTLPIVSSMVPVYAIKVKVKDYRGFCACIILNSFKGPTDLLAAQQLLQNISLSPSDKDKCDTWTAYPDYEISVFADRFDKPTTNISESAGVFAPDLYAFCGPPEVGEAFSFPDFSASTAGLLLPWIAIFAQLPRQTGSIFGDVLSLFISVGSPAWICANVGLAVLFSLHVRTSEAAKVILQAFIQAPVRLNPRPGYLSNLIICPENHQWWITAAAEIKSFWRKIDTVFIAQVFLAVLAWVLAIIADFWSLPGAASSSSAEWQICMGTLWLWVFAATLGPAAIKSLYKAKLMAKALSLPDGYYNKLYFPHGSGNMIQHRDQMAIVQRSGLVPRYQFDRRRSTLDYEIKNEDKAALDNVRVRNLWGFSIEGDAAREGLNTFICRFFSSAKTSNHIIHSFESFHDRLKRNQVPEIDQDVRVVFQTKGLFSNAYAADIESLDYDKGVSLAMMISLRPVETSNSRGHPERNLSWSPTALDRYLGIDIDRFTAYPEWKEINLNQWVHFIMANLFGLVVQWGTSGPAIYVMYYSPPVGLGCDSGGLLIYAVGATISWWLFNLGNILSHAALLHYQRYHYNNPCQPIVGYFGRTKIQTFLCGAAVIARILGKCIAVINAFWILTWSFLTYTNVMETPYCTTAYYSLSSHGWMRLWNFYPWQFLSTKVEELQCLVVGSFIAYFACVLIFSLTLSGKKKRYQLIIATTLSLGFFILVLPLYFYGVYNIRKA
ncbi:hypothetical protein BP6252_02905 [Coleophoma cylindrospora]|uniref:Uncharacterized protein n=1 Tax=Coleophoma cylindrospora TaxID=1849047 RepID=A0A3D8SG46_9HELO|nr:hypothetical protein BP6252_02905 [Coleophoma cylindrospora]